MDVWADERNVELLRRLFDEGLSATQIAGRIKGVSRNAVLGKIARLGLVRAGPSKPAGRPQRIKTPAEARADFRVTRPSAPASLPPLPMREEDPDAPRVLAAEFDGRGCKWPVGDPRSPDFGFCGCRRSSISPPYCDGHLKDAVDPRQPKTPIERFALGAAAGGSARRGRPRKAA